ncbi:MAG: glycosyltransferase family 9 protein [Vicinamibacteria bacterium]|nr:glycosyltransferase family 9 protein [Vicinamibacteria bacterium]
MTSAPDRKSDTLAPATPKASRALVIRVGALGDVLLTRRLTYSLSRAGLRSTLFAPGRHASWLRADPWIEGILDSESPRLAGAFAGEWPGEHGVFDLAVVISRSDGLARAALLAATSIIQVPPEPSRDDISIARQWADAVGGAAAPFAGPLPPLPTGPLGEFGRGATFIHPGSGSPSKNWPLERFIELSQALKVAGHRVILIRGPAEGTFPTAARGFEVFDRPSLGALGATLAGSRLFVGNDSGVSHLAAAAGAPTVTLFGPTSDVVWRPDGHEVVTVRSSTGGMEGMALGEVLEAVERLARLRSSAGR